MNVKVNEQKLNWLRVGWFFPASTLFTWSYLINTNPGKKNKSNNTKKVTRIQYLYAPVSSLVGKIDILIHYSTV